MSEKFYILRFKKNMHIRYALYSLYRYLYWIYSSQFMFDEYRRTTKWTKILYKCKKKVFRVHKFYVQFRISTETSSNVPYNIKINLNASEKQNIKICFSNILLNNSYFRNQGSALHLLLHLISKCFFLDFFMTKYESIF